MTLTRGSAAATRVGNRPGAVGRMVVDDDDLELDVLLLQYRSRATERYLAASLRAGTTTESRHGTTAGRHCGGDCQVDRRQRSAGTEP